MSWSVHYATRFQVCLQGADEWLDGCCEFMMAVRQVHHLDAVGVQALVVDQPFRQHQRLRRAVRLRRRPGAAGT